MAATNKRDIMAALLQDATEDTGHDGPCFAKLIHRAGETTVAKHPAGSPPCPDKKKKPGDDSKKKSTHYLSGEIFADLDEARNKINELMRPRLKSRVSKSRIVDQALRVILKEFEEKGEKSRLIKEISKGLRQK
jgi:hypothetical protein